MPQPRTVLRHLCLLACLTLLMVQAPHAVETGDLSTLRSEALELVNAARREQGHDPLTLSDTLNQAAQDHAKDMLARDYYAHVSPEGEDARDRYIAHGGDRYELVAENIAMCSGCAELPRVGTVEQMQERWMDSPHHRENILRSGITHFGYGIVADDGDLYAVQTFAGPGSPRAGTSAGTTDGAITEPRPSQGKAAASLDPSEVADAFVAALNVRREGAALETSDELSTAAAGLLPESADEQVTLGSGGLANQLPAGWGSASALVGSCGGCGAEVTETDIDQFLDMWLQEPAYADRLLGADPTAAGFALRAYGDGRKVAVAVLGRQP